MKAQKMTKGYKILSWVLMIMSACSIVFIIIAIAIWEELQLDNLDYMDERLAMMRAYYGDIPKINAWKEFRRGQPLYKKYVICRF